MLINTTGNEHCGRAVNSYSVGTILVANFCRRLEKNIFSHMGPRSEGFFFQYILASYHLESLSCKRTCYDKIIVLKDTDLKSFISSCLLVLFVSLPLIERVK